MFSMPFKEYVNHKIAIFYHHVTLCHLSSRTPFLIVTSQKLTTSDLKMSRNLMWTLGTMLKSAHILHKLDYVDGKLQQRVSKVVISRLVNQLKYDFWNNIFWRGEITLWLRPFLSMLHFVIFSPISKNKIVYNFPIKNCCKICKKIIK